MTLNFCVTCTYKTIDEFYQHRVMFRGVYQDRKLTVEHDDIGWIDQVHGAALALPGLL